MITVLVCYERISLFHTMEPFFIKKFRRLFYFTQSAEYCLTRDKNSILFMERRFQYRDPRDLVDGEFDLIKRLRDKYKTIVFLNGQPEAGTNRLDLLPYVDRLFYKSVFADLSNYSKDLYAKNLFTDYYHQKYGIYDKDREYRYKPAINPEDTKRIELSWNIGVGDYPRRNWPQRMGTVLARAGLPDLGRVFKTGHRPPSDFSGSARTIAVHARIDPVSCESIAYQRRLYLEKIKDDTRFLTGMVSQDIYYQELRDAKITLSPFGWGEVCFRDFEAIISGSLLLKPDMSHLKTWPDVYIPYETYVPTNWDGTDILEKAEIYLKDDRERRRIAQNAWEQYCDQLCSLEDRFISLFKDILV
ncbi:glycosyltransferase [Treponema primitia]|uniref:glycosyltransferase n=1 Tax=Treponema primitia TaxID=88058 RepID=UPI00397F89CA